MKYIVDVGGNRVEVSLDEQGVRVGDALVVAHLADVEGTPVQLVTIGDAVHRVVMQRGETRGAYALWIDGWRFQVDAVDERTRAIRDLSAASAVAAGPAPLKAPMPGMLTNARWPKRRARVCSLATGRARDGLDIMAWARGV